MDKNGIRLLFAMLRSAVRGNALTQEERNLYNTELLPELFSVAKQHDLAHLIVLALKQNSLIKENTALENEIARAAYRYELINCELGRACAVLESAQIDFIPLKGSVIRRYYPEPWMRTSGDIDILVRQEDLENAVSHLLKELEYADNGRGTHDVQLVSKNGTHIELHFDLLEEGRALKSYDILKNIWDFASVLKGSEHHLELTPEMFYFYHIAHMAKHFEEGGCGIRPFIDLWLLESIPGICKDKRDELLDRSGLAEFAKSSRRLCMLWFEGAEEDELSLTMQDYILNGGVYGTSENRVAVAQKKKGGRFGYILSRMFIPYVRLKRYYPILEKHKWLTPVMQVRRWFMLLNPKVAEMAKRELKQNANITHDEASRMKQLLEDVGL